MSFDLEMTGIANNSRSFIDSPEERYAKLKSAAERFKIIQLGIVPWKKKDSVYEAKPYNIYVFPNEESGINLINCEVSAMIFNREHKMDFNKWIYKGIQFLNSAQYKHLSDTYIDSNINNYNPDDPTKFKSVKLYKEEDKKKYQTFTENFNKFFQDETQKVFSVEKFPRFFLIYIINNLTQDQRKTLYISYTQSQNKTMINFTKCKEEEKKIMITEENKQKFDSIIRAKGVKNIFDAIIEHKKPLIGHNLSLDILYCIAHFEDPLPVSYSEFKKMIQEYFHELYDTKMIYHVYSQEILKEKADFNGSSLGTVYEKLREISEKKVAIKIADDFIDYYNKKNDSKISYHQADYDAFVTGCSFIYMKEMLNDEAKISLLNFKVVFMKSFYRCLNFNGEEDFDAPNTVCYCLKSKTKSYDFNIEKLLNAELFSQIKKICHVEGFFSAMIFVDISKGLFSTVQNELMQKGANYFEILSLNEFRKKIKEEEEKKNFLRKKQMG